MPMMKIPGLAEVSKMFKTNTEVDDIRTLLGRVVEDLDDIRNQIEKAEALRANQGDIR